MFVDVVKVGYCIGIEFLMLWFFGCLVGGLDGGEYGSSMIFVFLFCFRSVGDV